MANFSFTDLLLLQFFLRILKERFPEVASELQPDLIALNLVAS